MLVIALGVWLHVSKSRVPAVITLIYSIINVLVLLVATGKLGGWLILIAGIYAVIGTFKAKKAFKNAGGTK